MLALWLVLSDERLDDALRAGVAGVPALAVAGWAFTRPALVEDGALRADRVSDGRVFAALAVAGALVVAVGAWRLPVAAPRLRAAGGRFARRSSASCVVAVIGGSVGLVATVGNPFSWASSQFSGGECVNDPGRLTELCANNRLSWWGEALDVAADRPVGGSGAGTFALARRRYREDATPVSEPHSVPLQLLADLGVVGLALGLVAAAGAAAGAVRGIRRAPAGERAAGVALACLLVGVRGARARRLRPGLPRGERARAGGARRAARGGEAARRRVASASPAWWRSPPSPGPPSSRWRLPALAQREVDRALEAADAGRVEEAVDAADRARRLNPLSLGPLQARALAADAAGDRQAAVAWYEKATELQPENPDAWYDLGLYHAIATGDQCAAYQALNHSYTLDPARAAGCRAARSTSRATRSTPAPASS